MGHEKLITEQLFSKFAGVPGRDLPSVMSGFSISIQPAAPVSPIRLLCEQ